jgi:hypothetical protein
MEVLVPACRGGNGLKIHGYGGEIISASAGAGYNRTKAAETSPKVASRSISKPLVIGC